MIINEISNDKIKIQHYENDDVKIVIKKPTNMDVEKFKVKCASLSKQLAEFGCHLRLK